MKGKTSEGNGALAFYLMFEITGEQKFRKAALTLADQVLKDMRATKHGVLPIKEKDKPGGEKIIGGGPPALGAYASGVAYILHKEGGRNDDLKYIATVLDRYPWNEEGWWASTIDVDDRRIETADDQARDHQQDRRHRHGRRDRQRLCARH